MSSLIEIFSHDFMVRALIVGVAVALCAALVGVPLVLRKSSMLGDGLSHVAFGVLAIATVIGWMPLVVTLPVVVMASFWILRLSRKRRLQGDAMIAALSASSLAIGTMAISVAQGVNIDLNSYLFGSILAVGWGDVVLSVILTVVVVGFYLWAYHRIFAITFDEDFAQSVGVKVEVYDVLFAVICSIVVVLGMRLLGSLLISSLIIFPTLSAMRLMSTFRGVVVVAVIMAVVAFLVGLVTSYLLATPTGATVVITNLIFYLVALVVGKR